MIVPSIDLMDGKAVQLRMGEERILTVETDPVLLAREFNRYGEVAVIDLDSAMGKGDNLEIIKKICRVADVRAGGGIRDVSRAKNLLRAGALKIIIGTSATPEFLREFPCEKIIVALDHRAGEVVDLGWKRKTGEAVLARAKRLEQYCSGFLITFVEDEGGMKGMNIDSIKEFRRSISIPITVAGGIADTEEAVNIMKLGVDAQVGMSLYTGKLDLAKVVAESLDFERLELMPTIAQDEAGQVLMLAYSSKDSLIRALKSGEGVYYSRSRDEIWIKGAASGNRQKLISCRIDCDRDAILFTVRQKGFACHTGLKSCFGPEIFSIERLFEVLQKRKDEMPEGSYSAKLFSDRKLLMRKISEEAFEVTQTENRDELLWEIADLLYMVSALAVDEGLKWKDIESELGARKR